MALETSNLLTSKPRQWVGWFVAIECRCKGGRMFNLQTMCSERPQMKDLPIITIASKIRCKRCDTMPHIVEIWSHQDIIGIYPEPAVKIRIVNVPGGPA